MGCERRHFWRIDTMTPIGRATVFMLVAATAAPAFAQPAPFTQQQPLEPWQDLAVASINAEPMHATFYPFDDRDAALRDVRGVALGCFLMGYGNSNGFRGRTGGPRFFKATKPTLAAGSISRCRPTGNSTASGCRATSTRTTPSDRSRRPPLVPDDGNPVGSYRRTFRSPQRGPAGKSFSTSAGSTPRSMSGSTGKRSATARTARRRLNSM